MCVFVSIEQERVNESEREGERGGGEERHPKSGNSESERERGRDPEEQGSPAKQRHHEMESARTQWRITTNYEWIGIDLASYRVFSMPQP